MTNKKNPAPELDRSPGPRTFGQFLLWTRTIQGLSQKEMAKLLGRTATTVCGMEKGRHLVSPRLAIKIARKCGVSEAVAVQTALMDKLRQDGVSMSVTVHPEKGQPTRAGRMAQSTLSRPSAKPPLKAPTATTQKKETSRRLAAAHARRSKGATGGALT